MREDLAKIAEAIEVCKSVLSGISVELAAHDEAIKNLVRVPRDKPKIVREGNYKDWDEFYKDLLKFDPHIAMVLWLVLETGASFDYPFDCLISDYSVVAGGYVRLSIPLPKGKRASFLLSLALSEKFIHFMRLYRSDTKPTDLLFCDKFGHKFLRNAGYNAINHLFYIRRFNCPKPTAHVRSMYAIKYGITHK